MMVRCGRVRLPLYVVVHRYIDYIRTVYTNIRTFVYMHNTLVFRITNAFTNVLLSAGTYLPILSYTFMQWSTIGKVSMYISLFLVLFPRFLTHPFTVSRFPVPYFCIPPNLKRSPSNHLILSQIYTYTFIYYTCIFLLDPSPSYSSQPLSFTSIYPSLSSISLTLYIHSPFSLECSPLLTIVGCTVPCSYHNELRLCSSITWITNTLAYYSIHL